MVGAAGQVKPATGQPVRQLPSRQVMDEIHSRYANQMAAMVQENAELAVLLEQSQAREAELESQMAALRPLLQQPVASAGKV